MLFMISTICAFENGTQSIFITQLSINLFRCNTVPVAPIHPRSGLAAQLALPIYENRKPSILFALTDFFSHAILLRFGLVAFYVEP